MPKNRFDSISSQPKESSSQNNTNKAMTIALHDPHCTSLMKLQSQNNLCCLRAMEEKGLESFTTTYQDDVSSIASSGSSIHQGMSESEYDAEEFLFTLELKVEQLQKQESTLDLAYKENVQQAKSWHVAGDKGKAIASMRVVQKIQSQRWRLVHMLDEIEDVVMDIKADLTRQRTIQALQHAAQACVLDDRGEQEETEELSHPSQEHHGQQQVQIDRLNQYKRQVEQLDAQHLADSFSSSLSLQGDQSVDSDALLKELQKLL